MSYILNFKNKIIAEVNKSLTVVPKKQTAVLIGTKNRAFDGTRSVMSIFGNSAIKHHIVPSNFQRHSNMFTERFSITPAGV